MTKFIQQFHELHPGLVFHGGEYLKALPSGQYQTIHVNDVAALFLAANPELANAPDVQLAIDNQLCQLRSVIYRESIPTARESGFECFVRDCLVVGPHVECSPDDVVAAYENWAGKTTNSKSLGIMLRRVVDIKHIRRRVGAERHYLWKGVDLK